MRIFNLLFLTFVLLCSTTVYSMKNLKSKGNKEYQYCNRHEDCEKPLKCYARSCRREKCKRVGKSSKPQCRAI